MENIKGTVHGLKIHLSRSQLFQNGSDNLFLALIECIFIYVPINDCTDIIVDVTAASEVVDLMMVSGFYGLSFASS